MKHSSPSAILFALTLLSFGLCQAQSASLISDIRFPSEVTASNPVPIEIQVSDPYLVGSAEFQFGSEKQGPYCVVRCTDQEAGKPIEGSISELPGRKITIDTDAVTALKERTIYWLRITGQGSGCELRIVEPDGSLKRTWISAKNSKGAWRWVRITALEENEGASRISFFVPPKIDCLVDCVAFSKDPDFNPESIHNDANKFTWQTNSTSVGRHTFRVSAKANGKSDSRDIQINVLPGNENKVDEITGNYESAVNYIDLSKAATLPLNPADDNMKVLGSDLIAKGSISVGSLDFPLPKSKLGLIAVKQPKQTQEEQKPGEHKLFIEPQAQDMQRANTDTLPESIKIPMNGQFKFLHFLHGVRGSAKALLGEIFEYTLHYEDGTVATIPVREGERVAGQLRDYNLPLGSKACSSYFTGVSVNLYLSSWENPFPEKTVQSIDVTSKTSDYISFVAGIATSQSGNVVDKFHDDNDVAETKATIDANGSLGKVNRDLFSMNDPYLFTQLYKGKFAFFTPYLSFLSEMSPRHVRLWNPRMWTGHPNAEDIANLATVEDLPKEEREGLDWVKKEGNIRILYVICKTLPEKEMGEEANWPKVTDWYAAYVDYLVNKQKYPIDYLEIFNEQILGKSEEVRTRHYRFYNLLAPKIKKVCPSLKIGGTAECWPDVKMLEDLVINCGENMDFVSWHYYSVGTRTPFADILPRCDSFAKYGREIAAMLKRRSPNRKIESLLTEYNMRYGRPWKPPVDERLTKGYMPIWLSSVLMHCILAGNIDGAYFWHFAGGSVYGSVGYESNILEETNARPSAMLFEILNNRLGDAEMISSVIDGKSVECFALQTSSHVVLVVINKSDYERKVVAEILNANIAQNPGSFHRSVETYEIAAEDTDFTVTKTMPPITQKLHLSLRPFSEQLIFLPKHIDD